MTSRSSDRVTTVPDFMIWHCAGCGAPAEGKKKPCNCATNVGTRRGPNGRHEQTWWDDPEATEITRLRARVGALERERDAATRALVEIGTVLNAEHTKISGVSEVGLATVNSILHRLGRIVDAALAETEGKK